MDKPRWELFGDVVVHLDSAAGEAREGGNSSLGDYIEEVLIPFIEAEQLSAAAGEFGIPPVE